MSALDLSDYLTTTPDDPQGKSSDGAGYTGCITGYTYGPLDAQNSYLLVAALESNTGNGEGHYNLGDFTVTAPLTTPYSDQLAANTADLCAPFGASDCTTNGVAYIVGR
ncbi:MAG: hypothetical protein AAB802_03665 [Patescibacteria group bacterium]